jgi:multidrug efflux system membrane fusion protein
MNGVLQHWMRSARNHRTRAAMIGAGLLIIILMIAWHWTTAASAANAPAKAPAAIVVETTAAARADVPVYLEGIGTVQAFYTVTVTARVDGELQKVGFVEGQEVNKGDLLAQIDPRPYRAALEQAVAAQAKDAALLANAKQDLERYTLLAPDDLASKQTVDTQRALVAQLKAQIQGDQAAIDNAKTQLDYTTITSPIRGRTGIRLIDPGNNIRAADTTGLVVVTQLQPIAVIFTLPEDALSAINTALRAGPVSVAAMSRDGQTTLDRGTVALVDNEIDQTTGTVRVKATFPNKNAALWPGQFLNIRALVRTRRRALTSPSSALQRGPNGLFAYVVKADSTVEVRPLQVSADTGAIAVIRGGLREGERVVTSNQYRLQPNARVRAETRVAQRTATVAASGAEL